MVKIMNNKKKTDKRRRTARLNLSLTPEEKKKLSDKAWEARMSVSGFVAHKCQL